MKDDIGRCVCQVSLIKPYRAILCAEPRSVEDQICQQTRAAYGRSRRESRPDEQAAADPNRSRETRRERQDARDKKRQRSGTKEQLRTFANAIESDDAGVFAAGRYNWPVQSPSLPIQF